MAISSRQRQLPPREAQLIIPAPCCFHRVMCMSVYFRSCADTRRQLIAANTCQGIQAAAAAAAGVVAAAAGVGCCNCHCRCLSFALANQDLSPANDTTWRGLARPASSGCQLDCLLSSFRHRVNHNFAPSFTTVSTVGHVSETTCQIYHCIDCSSTWSGLAHRAHPLSHTPGTN